jgi:hypothetical protein
MPPPRREDGPTKYWKTQAFSAAYELGFPNDLCWIEFFKSFADKLYAMGINWAQAGEILFYAWGAAAIHRENPVGTESA